MTIRARAARTSAIVTAITILLVIAGSRGLRDFDAALIGYAVATVFAIAALTYRYKLWIARVPTGTYFRAGWADFLSWRHARRYTRLVPREIWSDLIGQTFIRRRGAARWLAHQGIFWGVIISLAVTVPLSFGWIRFTLVPPDQYRAWFFGFPVATFPIEARTGFAVFHILDFTALILIVGAVAALSRRMRDVGLLTTQRFGFDLLPLVLLIAIALTGLALTASSTWWHGSFYWFMALLHQVVVVFWLLSLPFGKFFHIIERPASVGITVYQRVAKDAEAASAARPSDAGGRSAAACRRCGAALPSARFISDLEGVLAGMGQRYDLGPDRGLLQDYCPTCKRKLRADAYYSLMKRDFL